MAQPLVRLLNRNDCDNDAHGELYPSEGSSRWLILTRLNAWKNIPWIPISHRWSPTWSQKIVYRHVCLSSTLGESVFHAVYSGLFFDERELKKFDRVEDVDELLSAIVRLRQLEQFAWIINERALTSQSPALFDGLIDLTWVLVTEKTVLGLLGVKLHHVFSEENLLIDALELISNTFHQFLAYPPAFWSEAISVINCSSIESWSYGNEVYRSVRFLHASSEQSVIL